MNCLCQLVNPIPQCVESIQVGTITGHNQDVIVIITEIVTGREQRIATESSVAGLVTIDTEDIMEFFSPNLLYELKIVSTAEVPIEFTIGAVTEIPCVQIPFTTGDSGLAILSI